MKSVTNANKTNIEITSGQSEVRFNVQNQTTEVMGLKSSVKGPSAEWEWNLKEDKTNKVQTISEHSSETQYPSAKCVYEAFQDIPEFVQKQSDWNETDNTKVAYIKNKPTIPVVPTDVSAFNNDAGYITISDVPEQVNSDWNSNSGKSQILNRPNLSTVATSGSYNDLSDKPTIPVVPTNVSAFNNDSGYVTSTTLQSDYYSKGTIDSMAQNWEDIRNKTTSVSSSSTDIQYPSAKAVYSAIPTALPVLIKYILVDDTNDYTIPSEPAGTMYAISIADGIGTVTIHSSLGTWWQWKTSGVDTCYPAGTGYPEKTATITDAGGGGRSVSLFIRIH